MKNRVTDNKLKKSILEKASETLDLPKSLTMQLPRLLLTGHRELFIENYRGILEYGTDALRIATSGKTVRVCGSALTIKSIASEEITLEGNIDSVSFEGGM